jgi:hypothetical protein
VPVPDQRPPSGNALAAISTAGRARRMSPGEADGPGVLASPPERPGGGTLSLFIRPGAAISLMCVRRVAINTNAILRGVPRYPAGTYDATEELSTSFR